MDDRYGIDVLADGWQGHGRVDSRRVEAEPGLVVEVMADGFCGAVTASDAASVELEDRVGARRRFALGPGFMIDGVHVVLVPHRPAAAPRRARTASGSIAAPEQRARVARASRILVEGKHDAELVEKVWGADLRAEGVVVEFLAGLDNLAEMLDAEPPGPGRRYGVLVDHLVPGSKEARIAETIARGRHGAHLHIVGHPRVDVWQCVAPRAVGIAAWPDVPRGTDIKVGTCRALGWPSETPRDLAAAWRRILACVHSYRDLEPALLGRVEELIDYVTAAG
ncbi:DUF3097 domain-containing protein [Microbacterium sediminicola]|uniref:DUF3097 domain-containing protein n=1 Tax=Microbacterium sediminicola TaxID=415210 RepID=A0ABN2HL61_9MICO